MDPYDATAPAPGAPESVLELVRRIDAGIVRRPWEPSWRAPDDGAIRARYTRGHGPCDYLDACRRRDVREAVRAQGARFLRIARALPDDHP